MIGERWRALDAEQKKEYEDKAKAKVRAFHYNDMRLIFF